MKHFFARPLIQRIGFIVGLLLILLSSYHPVHASSVRVIDNNVSLQFPTAIVFHLAATSDTAIEHISLIYTVISKSCTNSQIRQEFDIEPYTIADLSWSWDLKNSGNLPPGVVIKWQW